MIDGFLPPIYLSKKCFFSETPYCACSSLCCSNKIIGPQVEVRGSRGRDREESRLKRLNRPDPRCAVRKARWDLKFQKGDQNRLDPSCSLHLPARSYKVTPTAPMGGGLYLSEGAHLTGGIQAFVVNQANVAVSRFCLVKMCPFILKRPFNEWSWIKCIINAFR